MCTANYMVNLFFVRRSYLNYEGEVSGGRGTVSILWKGKWEKSAECGINTASLRKGRLLIGIQ